MGWPRWSVREVLAARPRIRINQVGYLPGRPMRATLAAAGEAAAGEAAAGDGPVAFTVRDRHGAVVYAGRSVPWPVRPEPTSGQRVHVLDFTGLGAEGSGFRIEAGAHISHPFAVGPRLYEPLAADALRFFTLMRCGAPVREDHAPGYGRPAGHLGDRSVPGWTGPDARRLYPGWHPTGRYDVSGGWYDAGDYGKYVTSGALAAWQLLGILRLGGRPGTDDPLVEECRWQLDWLLRMRVPAGEPLAGLAFHRVHGTRWPPLPCPPHRDPTERVVHRPSTGATLQLAAVTAQAARLLRDVDAGYAATLLAAAEGAYDAAERHPRLTAPDDHARHGGGPYPDDDLSDDAYWAAAELWLATGRDRYRRAAADGPPPGDPFDPAGFDGDRVAAPALLDLALAGDPGARDRVRRGADALVAVQRAQPWGQPYAPATGWAWGSNGRLLNNLVVLAVADLTVGGYHDAVVGGMDYLFGRNALGQSYVTGHGTDTTRHQRTRQFGRDLDPALPPPPPGALAGGANSVPAPGFPYDPRLGGLPPQCCYLDEPTSEVTNDVCIRWNAPLAWVAAYLSRPRT